MNNFNIKTFQTGVSNYDGEATIYDLPTEHTYSVTVNKNLNASHLKVDTATIPVTRLSTFIAQQRLPKIDLIKIDVETHEPEVLEGMGEYLKQNRPTMLIEVLSDEIGLRLEKQLEGLGYVYFNIDEVNPPQRVMHINTSKHFNYLICSEQMAEKLALL
jgi:FkbM family methyltransferase